MTQDSLRIVLSHVFAWPEVTRGAERYVHELAAAMAARGHEVRLLATAEQTGRTQVLDVPMRTFGRGSLGGRARLRGRTQVAYGMRCLADVLPRGADVWHAGSLYDGAAASLASTLRPTLRSVLTLHGPLESRVLSNAPHRQALSLALRADDVVCVSQAAAQQAQQARGVSAAVIPPGVDASAFTPGGSRADVPAVLYVGSLASRRKNVLLLLEAAALVDGLEVHLVGQGDPTPWIDQAPPGVRGRVRHLGALDGDALVAAYRRAWLTALVSEREVFGMTVVESLACGTPGVVLDDGWGPSSIVAEGTGVRAAATPEGLAEALRAGLELAREPGVTERCRSAGAAYDWQASIVPQLEALYLRG